MQIQKSFLFGAKKRKKTKERGCLQGGVIF